MRVIPVGSGDNLQAALDAAAPGDVLALDAGATFTGVFTLPPKSGVVTVTTNAPLPERRLGPADAALLPTLRSGSYESVLTGTGATHWRLDGLRFEANTGGHETLIALHEAVDITLDRILFVAPEATGQKRAVLGNGQSITLTRSHLAGIWTDGADSQAFAAWDGAGPYTLVDNYLEAASENILFGGADSASADRIPSDILIADNHLTKAVAWQGQAKVVKNLLELKCARRVTIRHNLLENCWTDAQTGFAVLFTVRNQDGRAPWSTIEDVLFDGNTIRNSENGINISGTDDERPSAQARGLVIRDNLIVVRDWLSLAGNEWTDCVVEHNTCFHGGPPQVVTTGLIWVAGDAARRPSAFALQHVRWVNNCNYLNDYGFFGDSGVPWVDFIAGTVEMTHNAFAANRSGQTLPGDNWYPSAAEHEAQFAPGYTLRPESPYQTRATDGGPLGQRPVAPVPPEPPEPEPAPPDTTDPAVAIVAVVRRGKSRQFEVTAEAFDTVGVARVEFHVEATLQAVLTLPPYIAVVRVPNRATAITVRAVDGAGNVSDDTWAIR